jgi:hypothetical protein
MVDAAAQRELLKEADDDADENSSRCSPKARVMMWGTLQRFDSSRKGTVIRVRSEQPEDQSIIREPQCSGNLTGIGVSNGN